MRTRAWIAVWLVCVASSAEAGKCRDVEKMMRDTWDEYDRQARDAGCVHPAGGPFKYMACAATYPKKWVVRPFDKVKGWWNGMARGGWATLGPRMFGPDWDEGKLVGTSGRTFLGAAPTNSGKVTVHLKKTDGRAETEVTICATRKGAAPREVANFRIENGKDNVGKDFSRAFSGLEDSIVTVNLDAKSVSDTFSYKVKLETEPLRWDFGTIQDGFADLHAHQASELGFGGAVYRGSHTGPAATALRPCDGKHGLPGANKSYFHGNGFPTHSDWPNHMDIGHQQIHESWIKKAHDGGLKLIVVSAVSSEPGCELAKIFHPRPGVSCRDMPNLHAQVDAFIAFDRAHDWYEIALDPWHARKIINEGKLAAVISLEASRVFPTDEGDLVDQLDKMYVKGVRTLGLAHEFDSRFAGAAPHEVGLRKFVMSAGQTVKHPELLGGFKYETLSRDGEPPGKWNAIGMKPDRYRLVDAMIARHMLIDFTHMSTKASEELFSHVSRKHRFYPLHQSHSRFRALLPPEVRIEQAELGTTEGQLTMVKRTGGVIGLRPGLQPILAREGTSLTAECHGTTRSFRYLLEFAQRRGVKIALGTDLSGSIEMMGTRFRPTGVSGPAGVMCPGSKAGSRTPDPGPPPQGVSREFANHGLRHIGLLPDVIADLGAIGTDPPALAQLNHSAEAFLDMWERA
ncbi:MAG: hypothetical protein EXR72_25945 [Myxococcales bacterium]|nr:hypothetical protein [Myxococcales bacterium]